MKRVLIADDEEFVRYYLRTLVQSMGYSVIEEVDSAEGLFEMIKETHPDILLLDINMPLLDGKDFLRIYGNSLKNLCVIVLTVSASQDLYIELEQRGYKYFIRKDTPSNELCEQIKECWEDFSKGLV